MADTEARRLTLLYQLYLTSQASRRFVRLALIETEMDGEQYALYSYLYANGPRTLSQAAHDIGLPVTTLATMLEPMIGIGEIARRPHPSDGRARLLALTDGGRQRLEAAIPGFTAAYRSFLAQLSDAGIDPEALYAALGELRIGLSRTAELLEAETPLAP